MRWAYSQPKWKNDDHLLIDRSIFKKPWTFFLPLIKTKRNTSYRSIKKRNRFTLTSFKTKKKWLFVPECCAMPRHVRGCFYIETMIPQNLRQQKCKHDACTHYSVIQVTECKMQRRSASPKKICQLESPVNTWATPITESSLASYARFAGNRTESVKPKLLSANILALKAVILFGLFTSWKVFRWRFQVFVFHLYMWEMIHFDWYFGLGWNHQLSILYPVFLLHHVLDVLLCGKVNHYSKEN